MSTSSFGAVFGISSAILIAYNVYVGNYSAKRSAFRNQSIIIHNAPGLILFVAGSVLWSLLGMQLFWDDRLDLLAPKSWFWPFFAVWVISFLINTFSGWIMIPQLPNVDPAVKREFISLVLCQISFLPVALGLVFLEWAPPMRIACYVISAVGFVTSFANLILYAWDYSEGKSQKVCSGDYLIKQMEKQEEERKKLNNKSTFLKDYIAICFTRGSHLTRMPANQIMLVIAVSIIVPFLIFPFLSNRFERVHEAYPSILKVPNMILLLVLGTVGNMQVFHGTLAVRGKDTVNRASTMVLSTVAVEMVLVYSVFGQALGLDGFVQYLLCIPMQAYCPGAALEV